MYKMRSVNPVLVITVMCFIFIEAIAIFESLLVNKGIGSSIIGGSIFLFLISFLIGLLFTPLSRRYFFYSFVNGYFIRKYFFWEKRINLADIQAVEFYEDKFKILLKNNITHVERNRLSNDEYEKFQIHFRKVINE